MNKARKQIKTTSKIRNEKKLFKLDFDRSQSIYSQSNKKVISNLKLKRSTLE